MLNQIKAAVMLKTPLETETAEKNSYDRSACPGDFLPDLATIIKTAHFFRDLGFRVWPYQHYLQIEATPQLFEETLGAYDEDKLQVPDALRAVLVRVMFIENLVEAS